MFERENSSKIPTMGEISCSIANPVFDDFVQEIMKEYQVEPILEFSKCSMEYGWNLKFKKLGKSLCTIYPKESIFTVMVVIGRKEKNEVEKNLPNYTVGIQELYQNTKEGMGQKWLMIDLEDKDRRYEDVLNLIKIRMQTKK